MISAFWILCFSPALRLTSLFDHPKYKNYDNVNRGISYTANIHDEYLVATKINIDSSFLESNLNNHLAISRNLQFFNDSSEDYAFGLSHVKLNSSNENSITSFFNLLDDDRVLYFELNHQTRIFNSMQKLHPTMWNLDVLSNMLDFNKSGFYHYNYTGKRVTVHVLDTGCNVYHSEFEGRVQSLFVASTLRHEGLLDLNGHGTFVAGIIGGKIHGVAKDVMIYCSKVLSKEGKGNVFDIIEVLNYIQTFKGTAINLSLGGYPSFTLNEIIRRFTRYRNIVFVVAAGNSNQDACNEGPANSVDAITVGSHDSIGKRSSFSNFGSCVDFYAPGESIRSTSIPDQYSYRTSSGTSFAAPCVTGIIAQLFEMYPSADAKVIVELLDRSTKLTAVQDYLYGSNTAVSSFVNVPCVKPSGDYLCVSISGTCENKKCLVSPFKNTIIHERDNNSLSFYQPFLTSFKKSKIRISFYERIPIDQDQARMSVVISTNGKSEVLNSTRYPLHSALDTMKGQFFSIEIAQNIKIKSEKVPYVAFFGMPRHCMDTQSEETQCSGNGDCVDGECRCYKGFVGSNCDITYWNFIRKKYRGWWYRWLLKGETTETAVLSLLLSVSIAGIVWLAVVLKSEVRVGKHLTNI